MLKSKVKNAHNLSKYTVFTKDLNPNNPFHARILENFRNIKRQEDEKIRNTQNKSKD